MLAAWHRDIESLEAISQDDGARDLFLHMAELARSGRLEPFLDQLQEHAPFDGRMRELASEIAEDSTIVHAVDDYVRRTAVQH